MLKGEYGHPLQFHISGDVVKIYQKHNDSYEYKIKSDPQNCIVWVPQVGRQDKEYIATLGFFIIKNGKDNNQFNFIYICMYDYAISRKITKRGN